MTANDPNNRSDCPLSCALDLIGDKWSLLVIRDICLNKKRYVDFQSSPEKIPTNILASRLKRLEETGIIVKKPYQTKPLRCEYLLTVKGADLLPVLQTLAAWAEKHVPSCIPAPEFFFTLKPENLFTR